MLFVVVLLATVLYESLMIWFKVSGSCLVYLGLNIVTGWFFTNWSIKCDAFRLPKAIYEL